MEKTMEKVYLPEWLQTEEQQLAFLEQLKPITQKNPTYYAVETKAIHRYLFQILLPHLAAHGFVLRPVRVDARNTKEYLESGRYLPDFLQDFHDGKRFFKYMHQNLGEAEVSWMKAQCYVTDIFLWSCTRHHQCKLQKTLKKGEYLDLYKAIDAFDEAQRANYVTELAKYFTSKKTAEKGAE